MKNDYKPKKHIKVYADARWLRLIKSGAEDNGLTQSGYLFMCFIENLKKNKIKRSK